MARTFAPRLTMVRVLAAFTLAWTGVAAAAGLSAGAAAELDLHIRYYSKTLTEDGVLRESRYEETMLRRSGHVWVARVLPAPVAKDSSSAPGAAHKHEGFNAVKLPRHVVWEDGKLRLEFVDLVARQVISVPKTEYGNVNFDGSWVNAFFLLDPRQLVRLQAVGKPLVDGTRWRQREVDGVVQRVLWDERRQIPLVVESGDKAGRFYSKIEVIPDPTVRVDLPWLVLKAFGQKEYSDFLD